MQGRVSVGFTKYLESLQKKQFRLTYTFQLKEFFGDYYVLFDIPTQFTYVCTEKVEGFALEQRFLMENIFMYFPPKILQSFQERSKQRYKLMSKSVKRHRDQNLSDSNKTNMYYQMNIVNTKVQEQSAEQI